MGVLRQHIQTWKAPGEYLHRQPQSSGRLGYVDPQISFLKINYLEETMKPIRYIPFLENTDFIG